MKRINRDSPIRPMRFAVLNASYGLRAILEWSAKLGLEMKLRHVETCEQALVAFGEEACAMLARNDWTGLATRFGYALTYSREPATAIQADFLRAAASPFGIPQGSGKTIAVQYFKPNSTGLFAVVECTVPVADGAAVQMSLVVFGEGEEKHITLEDIAGVPEEPA